MDNHDDWLLLKYEDMVLNTEAWIQKTAKFLGVTIDAHLCDRQTPLLDFNVENEDLGAHKRQVMPGDHKRKLKPETIELLNRKLGGVLRRFGYS